MKNNNNQANHPAFPCTITERAVTSPGTSLVLDKAINYTGLTKREIIAAHIAPAICQPKKHPKTFLDAVKNQLNKLGCNFKVRFTIHSHPISDAQWVAVYTDAILNQLNPPANDC